MILNKTILIDCDGVLLNWIDSFIVWMSGKGYPTYDEHFGDYGLHNWFQLSEEKINELVLQFNESVEIGFLNPLPGAIEYVSKLVNDGYRFVVITSMTDNPYSRNLRSWNLVRVFGDVFDDLICLPLRKCKKEELAKLKAMFGPSVKTIWIDDHIYNAEVGQELGFETIVFGALHNKNWSGKRANSWMDLYIKIKEIEANV